MDKLRILITSRYEIDSYTKPLVDHLRHYCEVICGANVFWESDQHFNIIHFQWPEELFGWSAASEADLEKLEARMAYWKNNGAKLVITRHNERPHNHSASGAKLYSLFETYCDGQTHMGNYSLEHLSYPKALNVVIEHPNNIDLDQKFDKNKIREKYGIATNKTVFLLFGSLRKKEEEFDAIRNFLKVKEASDVLYVSHSHLLKTIRSGNILQRFFKRLQKRNFERQGIIFRNNQYDNTELNELMALADVVFISRIHNLNSGILYLSYSFRKLVIAPSIGNIAEKLFGNPSFVPNQDNSMQQAINNAKKLIGGNQNMINFEYVKSECDPAKLAHEYFDFYNRIINRNT